jgi:hypothetical protein
VTNKEKQQACLVVKAALLQHTAGLHVLGLGGTSVLISTRRPGESLTPPPLAIVLGSSWTEAGVVVLDESTSSLKQMVNKNLDQVIAGHTFEYVQKKSLGSSPSTAGYEQNMGSVDSSCSPSSKPN